MKSDELKKDIKAWNRRRIDRFKHKMMYSIEYDAKFKRKKWISLFSVMDWAMLALNSQFDESSQMLYTDYPYVIEWLESLGYTVVKKWWWFNHYIYLGDK